MIARVVVVAAAIAAGPCSSSSSPSSSPSSSARSSAGADPASLTTDTDSARLADRAARVAFVGRYLPTRGAASGPIRVARARAMCTTSAKVLPRSRLSTFLKAMSERCGIGREALLHRGEHDRGGTDGADAREDIRGPFENGGDALGGLVGALCDLAGGLEDLARGGLGRRVELGERVVAEEVDVPGADRVRPAEAVPYHVVVGVVVDVAVVGRALIVDQEHHGRRPAI